LSIIVFRLNKLVLVVTCGLLALLLVGCDTPGVKPQPGAYTTAKSGIQLADSKVADAAGLASPERDHLLLDAAEIYLQAGRALTAESVLAKIDSDTLDIGRLARYSLVAAELALANELYPEAAQLLANPRLDTGIRDQPAELRARWHRVRGELFAILGDESRSAFEYTRLVPLLTDDNEVRGIHDRIWKSLSRLSDEEIYQGANLSSDEIMGGWLRLAAATRETQGDIGLQVDRIRHWQQANPTHPAAKTLPHSLQQATLISAATPDTIALLLPGDGEYKLAAETIRDGILAAYYEVLTNGGEVPTLVFYDTQTAPITEIYQQAVAAGADMILGPLRRDQLSTLLAQPVLPIPVLGLNYVEDSVTGHDNVYQFGLSIRDEAAQIAERAWLAGHRSVLAITPETGWGNGALEAFRDSWHQRGGRVTATITYATATNDYTPLLEPAFLVKHSRERAQRLQRLLGKNLDFTPRRRGDVDMIFLIANPEHGRQIKPTLDFLYAADLPVFSTSHIYNGAPNPGQDRDLDGIAFSAMPWTVKAFTSGNIRPRAGLPGAYRNLFAMGADAYRLHQWLELLKSLPNTQIHGYTGGLAMDGERRIVRTQPWAIFRDGRAVPATLIGPQSAATR